VRWLIGSFFARFQKIDSKRRDDQEIRDFSGFLRNLDGGRTRRRDAIEWRVLWSAAEGVGVMRLAASALACIRGGRRVFDDLTFTIAGGTALVVTGPNGAGKSSLLRLVGGLLRPANGRLALDGGDPELTIGEQAHYLGHQDAVKPSLSVRENLAFWTQFLGSPAAKVDGALGAVGLDELGDLPALYLSAGQRRRLSLARLVAVPRPIWLLDEPTSALDAAAQALLEELMRSHLSTGGLMLVATHAPLNLERSEALRLGATA
jgi:heme exporter protein A